jgi:hypothetical protein
MLCVNGFDCHLKIEFEAKLIKLPFMLSVLHIFFIDAHDKDSFIKNNIPVSEND